jgi:hypothetical protein
MDRPAFGLSPHSLSSCSGVDAVVAVDEIILAIARHPKIGVDEVCIECGWYYN